MHQDLSNPLSWLSPYATTKDIQGVKSLRFEQSIRKLENARAQRLNNFKILKFSSEIENFKRAAHQTPIFCGEFWRSRLKISSEIENFKRDWIFSIFGPLGEGWLFPGTFRGFPRRTPGKSWENRWKNFPESRNAINSRISGTRKGESAGNLMCPDLVPTFCVGCFLKSTVPTFAQSCWGICPTHFSEIAPEPAKLRESLFSTSISGELTGTPRKLRI